MTGRNTKHITDKPVTFYGRTQKSSKSNRKDAATKTGAINTTINFEISVGDILDSCPFYALLVDEDHYILQANTSVLDKLVMKPEEIVGQFCPAVVHGVEGMFYGCPLEEALEKNEGIERDVYDEHSERWLRSAIYPTRALTQNGKKIFFHMVTDITDAKQAEMQLQIALDRLRSLTAHLESVREEERRKIAHDLHDETSQVLASLSAHLQALGEAIPAEANRAHALLDKSQELTLNIYDELSRLIYELRPSLLDELGLLASISSLAENNLEAVGIEVDTKISGRVKELSRDLEIALFRVVQEIFSNIIRHADAKNVKVRLQFKKNSIKIHVSDDGVGFNTEDAISYTVGLRGFGLIGMKERIELLSGVVDISSSPGGGGTRIDIEVPLDHKS